MPNTIHIVIISILSLVSAVLMCLCSYKTVQIYQMSAYKSKEFFGWIKKTKFDYIARYFSLSFFSVVPMALFIACFGRYNFFQYLGFLFFVAFSLLFFRVTKKQIKVPLRYTARAKRLILFMAVIYALISFPLFLLTYHIRLQYIFIGVLPLLIPPITAFCNTALLPVEKMVHNKFRKKAERKLEVMPSLIRIAITGSFGKTTAKNILAAFLSSKYKVCAGPKSYNTPMGLARVINENLSSDDGVFIAEMGARHIGDIKELCDFIKPEVGILTAIGEMHLESFGSMENIIKTKSELIDCLPAGGTAVFCGESSPLVDIYNKCSKRKLMSFCADSPINSFYSGVVTDENGTAFELSLDGEVINIRTKLLGNHIPKLMALCALVALDLGVSANQIADAACSLEPVPHRLELIRKGNTIIIDDAYNSNPEGAKNALDILCGMQGTKIVVTPGMVELGCESKKLHEEFGRQIAACADYVILVGQQNSADILAGLKSGNMPADKVFQVKTLADATETLGQIPAERKVVLFENDLPDNY